MKIQWYLIQKSLIWSRYQDIIQYHDTKLSPNTHGFCIEIFVFFVNLNHMYKHIRNGVNKKVQVYCNVLYTVTVQLLAIDTSKMGNSIDYDLWYNLTSILYLLYLLLLNEVVLIMKKDLVKALFYMQKVGQEEWVRREIFTMDLNL